MTKNLLKLNLLLIIIVISGKISAFETSASWPEFSTPENTKALLVADNIKHNGLNMQIYETDTLDKNEAVLQKYKDLWQKKYNIIKEISHHNKKVISTHVFKNYSNFIITLEAENYESTHAIASIIDLTQRYHPAEVIEHHLPVNSHIVNDTFAVDQHILSRTLVAQSPLSVMHLTHMMTERLESDGWIKTSGFTNNPSYKTALLEFTKENRKLLMTIEALSGTQIAMIYTENNYTLPEN